MVITPHIAFSSDASVIELRRSAAEEVVRVLRGETTALSLQPTFTDDNEWSVLMSVIRSVHGRQVLDSRGRPTVEVEVSLDDGVVARASVPSGASTGTHEAHELRDGDDAFFDGLGVLSAVEHVNGEIAAALRGHDVMDQQGCDRLLRELDGTPGLSRLGANAVLGTSLAICRASATVSGQPLYRRIADLAGVTEPMLPMPMVNILSGGLHAGRGMDVQDFLAVPIAATSMLDAIRLTAAGPRRGDGSVRRTRPADPARRRRRAEPGLPHRPGRARAARRRRSNGPGSSPAWTSRSRSMSRPRPCTTRPPAPTTCAGKGAGSAPRK